MTAPIVQRLRDAAAALPAEPVSMQTHVLSLIVWIGGMVFVHFFLRPGIAQFEPPVRLRLQ